MNDEAPDTSEEGSYDDDVEAFPLDDDEAADEQPEPDSRLTPDEPEAS